MFLWIFMLNGVTMKINVDSYILNTLKEDITSEDVSTNAVMPENKKGSAQLICKQDGVICGLDVFERAFKLLDENSCFETDVKDGDEVKKGQLIGVVYGDIKALLSAERTGLNYLQRMSGIATITREYANELKGKSGHVKISYEFTDKGFRATIYWRFNYYIHPRSKKKPQ